MENKKITATDMRHELARVCDKVDRRDCGKPCCPLYDLCAVLGNPRTAKAEYVRAMYLIYKHRKGERLCRGKQPVPICVKNEQVDGMRIKENVFYMLKNGEFVEVDS